MDYSAPITARAEYDQMVRSESQVSEFGDQVPPTQPHWLERQAARLLITLKPELLWLTTPMKVEDDRVRKMPPAE